MLNNVTLIGHLGRDPSERVGDRPLAFSMATSERIKDKVTGEYRDITEWHNVVIFEPGLIEVAEKYLRRGSKVYVEGRMATRAYEDRDGIKRTVTEVVLRFPRARLVLLDRRDGDRAPAAASEDGYGAMPESDYA
jgi:single-strand DNA-binding protein